MEDRKMIEKLKEHLEEALSKLYIENTRIDNEMTNLHYQHGIAGYDQDLPSRFTKPYIQLLLQKIGLSETHRQVALELAYRNYTEIISKLEDELSNIKKELRDLQAGKEMK